MTQHNFPLGDCLYPLRKWYEEENTTCDYCHKPISDVGLGRTASGHKYCTASCWIAKEKELSR